MMRSLAAVIVLFYFAHALAVAPYGIKGQAQSGTLYSNVHQFPNNQVTNLGGINALVETGNTNILVNPNFSHSSYLQGWDVTGDTSTKTEETVVVISGTKAAKFVASSQSISLKQSSSLYAAQFADGVQGLAMVRIKSSIALKVCSIQAGTVSTVNCVTTATDSKWGLYKVPFILGGTSNGISIASNGVAVSGTVYVDDSFVGAVDLKQDVDQSKLFAKIIYTSATNCIWSVVGNSVSYQNFPADNDCSTPIVTGSGTAPSTKIPAITLPSMPKGDYLVVLNYNHVNSNGGLAGDFSYYRVSTGTIHSSPSVVYSSLPNVVGVGSSSFNITNDATQTNVTIQAQAYSQDTSQIYVGGDTATFEMSVYYYPPASSIYTSTCGANCVDTFSASVSSTGVVSSENIDWINGNCSITSTSIYSCTFKTGIFTVPPVCTFGAGTSEPLVQHSALPSSTGLSVLTRSAGGTFTAGNFQVICQKSGVDFVATRTIVGSFKDAVISTGSNTGADIQSVYFGSGAACSTANCTINNLIGNKITSVSRSAAGVYTINGIDGTKYNCNGSGYDSLSTGNSIAFMHDRTLSTSAFARMSTPVAAINRDVGWASIICIGVP